MHLNAYQVAAIRIVSSGMILLPYAVKAFRNVPANKIFTIFLSGVLGSLLPAFLFCIAEEGIDSALAGTLNSLTPIFVIIAGALIYKTKTTTQKILGILVALSGSILLLISKGRLPGDQNILFAGFVVVATVCYGINVNMVHDRLKDVGSIHIAAIALTLNAIPALLVLILTGYFKQDLSSGGILISTGAATILGVMGTALASILFYKLIKRAGSVFSSTVTYGIPVVANIIGLMVGEDVGWKQWLCLLVLLLGVYIANRKQGEGAD